MEERAYTIPLRVVYNRAARKERAKRAMRHIREFVAKHMKVEPDNVKIHVSVNHVVWQRGIEKPPRKVKVVAVKEGETVWVYTPEERAKISVEPKKAKRAKKAEKEEEKEVAETREIAEQKEKEEEEKGTKKKSTGRAKKKSEEA
ncbi:MAG: large subunit ribosomal protein L31e [Candidatus Diapherotrites archaeon]|nr:large subunit ribosomal protein L31e [Candidatus Diapherotrites archaeon]MDN5366883.1 large subunit ribosomal protein L31e [Candidatus Diapherotrites archaeon]